ncbi:MAG: hypothetical protein ACI8UR_001210 [Natronomonas sp.]|jgi:hypothetical protein|uniref:hypothetical protein n=1 Tax=Natronomonas sp. TaxID=2184060 RepID=UPI003989988A
MVGSRTATALAGLIGSVLVSALIYYYTGSLLFFLFVPFVPFLFGAGESETTPERPLKTCPRCDFETRSEEFDYCPRDGSPLHEEREN